MKTFIPNIVHTRTDVGHTLQIIEYRGILISRQFDTEASYLVTVELGGEDCDFNCLRDAIDFIEDELNAADQRVYYRTQADLNREWSSLGR